MTTGVAAAQIPPSMEARMALWRDHLAGKQLLLLLDNAVGHEQVRPLLPGTAGSLVLVTSRRHLTALEDAQALSLDTLQPDEAASLLIRLAARPGLDSDDEIVGQITRLCGYLPLAIGMLARQLYHHPHLDPRRPRSRPRCGTGPAGADRRREPVCHRGVRLVLPGSHA